MKSAITISNYEEFFLLYVDGELSAADRQAVEQFVQANPYLAVELEMLQQVQLPGEQMIFGEKDSLYRSEAEGINLVNHEEQFLLYVDNELGNDAKEKVETFVLQHPALQETFTLLKQTKLEPELILFVDKPSLYRKEKKRVFYIGWQRVAVAAVLIGFVALLWTVLPNNKTQQPIIAKAQQSNNPANPAAVKNNTQVSPRIDDNVKGSKQPDTNIPVEKNIVIAGNKMVTPAVITNTPGNANPLFVKNDVPVKPVATQKQDIIASVTHNGFETATSTTQKVSGGNPSVDNADLVRAAMTPDRSNSVANEDVQSAVYKELDTEDEKKSLLLGSLEINKDKLRGFFRKAGSIFRSKSKTEEDKTESSPSSNTRSLK